MKINALSGMQELVDSISATCDRPCTRSASREAFACVAVSASPLAEVFPPLVGDILRAPSPLVEVTLRSSTSSAMDASLRRDLPCQTLASIYSTLIEFLDMPPRGNNGGYSFSCT